MNKIGVACSTQQTTICHRAYGQSQRTEGGAGLGVVKGQGKKKLELAIEINNNKYEKTHPFKLKGHGSMIILKNLGMAMLYDR
jgi:hypothetical protein